MNFKKHKKLKKKYDFLEPEEALFNKTAMSKLEPDENIQKLEIETGFWGIKLLKWSSILIFFCLLSSIFYLSIVRGEDFRADSERNSLKFISIPAERGLIYDRYNIPLVHNEPVFDLVFFPNHLPTDETERIVLLDKIESALSISKDQLTENISKESGFLHDIVLKSNLSNQEVISLESYFAGIPSVQIVQQNIRRAEDSYCLSHILGYLGRVSSEDLEKDPSLLNSEKIGKDGIEASYEKELSGTPGKIVILRNALMEVLGQGSSEDPKSGDNIKLAIDIEFQEYLYNRLKAQIKSLGNVGGGAGIAMDSQTGEILALVSYPGFDINELNAGISTKEFENILNSKTKPFFNRAISGLYHPGSTIKPLLAIAGLEENVISPNKKVETHGSISIPNPYNPDSPSIFVDWKNHGIVDMYSAIARSSNVYFYILGGGYEGFKGLGIDRIAQYLDKFGFEQLTGIDLIGEQIGFIPTPEKKQDIWRIGDTYITSIGQGETLVTPIRLLTSLNSLINNGKLLKPRLALNTFNLNKDILWENELVIEKENFINSENLDAIKEAMIQTVKSSSGTGRSLDDLPFSVGGKSGTAQTASNTKLNALFFAFAPTEIPKISMLILVENAEETSLNAIPIVEDVLYWYWKERGF